MSLKKGIWDNCLEHASISDVGMRRESNQDAVTVNVTPDRASWQQAGHVLMVADGMGAHAAGELASKLAVDNVPHLFYKYVSLLRPVAALDKSLRETNSEVHRRGQANLDFNNMGTTASVLVLGTQGAFIGHIGDSRIYRLRGSTFEQWTCDHSLVWDLRRAGSLTKEQERTNAIPKNVITKSIGPYPDVTPDIEGPLPLRAGDTFLLCTDGLTARMTDEELATITANFPPPVAAQLLVDLTNMRGGPDNTTIVIARIKGQPMETAAEPVVPELQLEQPRVEPNKALPVYWIAASVLGLASLVMLIVQQYLAAAVVAAGGVVTSICGWAARSSVRQGGGGGGRRSGEGPYVTVTAADERGAEQMLRDALIQVRNAARSMGWEEDVESLDEMEQSAESALRRGAIREALDTRCQEARELAERLRIFHARRANSATRF